MDLHTRRLVLRPAHAALLLAELESDDALAQALGAVVPPDWPPPLLDAGSLQQMLALARVAPGVAPSWPTYYLIEREAPAESRAAASRTLVGIGGFKGPPDAQAAVEIGYAIVPSRQGRGLAKEAVGAWLVHAFADPAVAMVVAHALPESAASIAVLRAMRFEQRGLSTEPDAPQALRYEISRWEHAHGRRPR